MVSTVSSGNMSITIASYIIYLGGEVTYLKKLMALVIMRILSLPAHHRYKFFMYSIF